MTEGIYQEQELIRKSFNADSCTIQVLSNHKAYTVIAGDFSICFDICGKCAVYIISYKDVVQAYGSAFANNVVRTTLTIFRDLTNNEKIEQYDKKIDSYDNEYNDTWTADNIDIFRKVTVSFMSDE